MRLGVDPAGDGQPRQLQGRIAVVAGFRIATGADIAPLHRAHAGVEVELGGQHLGGKVILGNVGVETFGVEEDGVTAYRLDNGNTPVNQ